MHSTHARSVSCIQWPELCEVCVTIFSVFIANIDQSYLEALELLKLVALSVARSLIPGCRTDVDKPMKETFPVRLVIPERSLYEMGSKLRSQEPELN